MNVNAQRDAMASSIMGQQQMAQPASFGTPALKDVGQPTGGMLGGMMGQPTGGMLGGMMGQPTGMGQPMGGLGMVGQLDYGTGSGPAPGSGMAQNIAAGRPGLFGTSSYPTGNMMAPDYKGGGGGDVGRPPMPMPPSMPMPMPPSMPMPRPPVPMPGMPMDPLKGDASDPASYGKQTQAPIVPQINNVVQKKLPY